METKKIKSVRKLRLIPIKHNKVDKEAYDFIKNEQYNQYQAMNLCMTLLSTNSTLRSYNSGAEYKLSAQIKTNEDKISKAKEKINNSKREDTIKKQEKLIDEYNKNIEKLKTKYEESEDCRTDIDEKFNDMYVKNLYTVVQKQVKLQQKDNMSLITNRTRKDFTTALKNGMARGERSLTSYRRGIPLMVRGRDLILYHDGEDVYIKWIRGITFKVIIGRKDKNYKELHHTLHEIISNQVYDKKGKKAKDENKSYQVGDSSLQFDDNKLILNLNFDIKVRNTNEFKEGRIVGVDLGMKIPAYCALNDVHYIKRALGSEQRLIDTSIQMKSRLKRLQKETAMVKGGKGRKKKTKALERLKGKESDFRKTFQHKISKDIIDFAIKNNAGQINMEFLSLKDSKNSFILQNWGYYQLQQMIKYKAEREGIIVKCVDPYRTSQTCSKCGHYEEGQRETQESFVCKVCGFSANADYNASRNIAKSDKYISSKEESEYYKMKKKQQEEEEEELVRDND